MIVQQLYDVKEQINILDQGSLTKRPDLLDAQFPLKKSVRLAVARIVDAILAELFLEIARTVKLIDKTNELSYNRCFT
ncbi:hypothetical protein Micau_2715 [Micromonospora aurantiaca ATCC 27029]|nr:hypothetical protein Micau_2715 [Micromonospora aurantiaca ATCC 27029]